MFWYLRQGTFTPYTSLYIFFCKVLHQAAVDLAHAAKAHVTICVDDVPPGVLTAVRIAKGPSRTILDALHHDRLHLQ
jgi:hypothetical protein